MVGGALLSPRFSVGEGLGKIVITLDTRGVFFGLDVSSGCGIVN